ncbi:hypothetical protein GCM10010284_43240 [Streptomyces rubiginosohelvolus]|uniref:Uncharacterized protein n=1 Tax=Streptomyces rubiginosohelvolus TaxID=67362 RepID=A0ABQ3BSQ0_9ACTN|nr:hypothetical protein GCM10010284_43240 [Streptomyces rubiginosohelvolus]GGZ55938.1 hypothetical protein GCM10010328_33380 [Streptomyces pluricolorescens]
MVSVHLETWGRTGGGPVHDAVESITRMIGIDYMAESKTPSRGRDRIVTGKGGVYGLTAG